MPRIVDDDLFQRTVKALCDTSASARALCDLLLTPKNEGGVSPQSGRFDTAATPPLNDRGNDNEGAGDV